MCYSPQGSGRTTFDDTGAFARFNNLGRQDEEQNRKASHHRNIEGLFERNNKSHLYVTLEDCDGFWWLALLALAFVRPTDVYPHQKDAFAKNLQSWSCLPSFRFFARTLHCKHGIGTLNAEAQRHNAETKHSSNNTQKQPCLGFVRGLLPFLLHSLPVAAIEQ